jgi:hypothetical protein
LGHQAYNLVLGGVVFYDYDLVMALDGYCFGLWLCDDLKYLKLRYYRHYSSGWMVSVYDFQ